MKEMEKSVPGCMGRMINILAPTPGTKMISNKTHQTSPADSVSSPVDYDPKRNSLGVVAKLMGLEALPPCRDSPRRGQQEDRCLRKGAPPSPEKRMDLVRQKFSEAKRLATDQRLLQSKEFQDALEVLSTNRDLFLKFLEEPNSLLSQPTPAPPLTPPSLPTKRITVLKPSKSAESLPPPTRIVVLKPSLRNGQETTTAAEAVVAAEEVSNCREVAKEITRQIRESLSGNCRDDTLLSSVLFNGYTGDESSFNSDNLSDSELISWEQGNRLGSPFSLSSLSRGSYSPDSSVVREAKKRLSDRWSTVASGGISNAGREQHQRQVRRSSSTLGEMLSIPEKKEEGDDGSLCSNRDEYPVPVPELPRSKSVPSSSSPLSTTKRSLFKEKVSSLFFPRSKKQAKEKTEDHVNSGSMAEAVVEQPGPVSVSRTSLDDLTLTSSSLDSRREIISRSPLIGSVARSLTRPAPKPLDQYSFLKSLLEAAGLGGDVVVCRWHSPESPLDPLLLESFLEEDDGMSREWRSERRLLFDAANLALLEIARDGTGGGSAREEVWRRVKCWSSPVVDQPTGTGELVMRTEVAGSAWGEMIELEREEIGGGIAAAMLEEMIGDVLLELCQRRSQR